MRSAFSAASNVFLIALVIIAAHVLGDKSFGEFSFALALASIFEMFTDLGLNTLSARNVSRDRSLAKTYLPNVLGWKLVLSALAMLLMLAVVKLMHQSREAELAAYILGGSIVLRSYKSTSFAFFQAFERFDLILLTTYIERLSGLVFGAAALILTRSLLWFCAVFALVRIPDILITYWLVQRSVARVGFRLDRAVIRKLQPAAMPFAFSAIVLAAYMQIGIVLLSALRPAREVGWFSAGFKIYEGLTTLPFLLCAVLLPRLSHLYLANRARHGRLYRRAMGYATLAALPALAVIGFLSPMIVRLLYGRSFEPAVGVLRVLLMAAAFMFGNWLMNTVLISADMEKRALRVWTLGLVVSAAMNLLLIPRLGAMGAAYAVVGAEAVIFVGMAVSVRAMNRSTSLPAQQSASFASRDEG